MSPKPVVPREQARQDVEEAVDYYTREVGRKVALAFVGAVEHTYRTIADQPAIGSPRYAYELDLPALRTRPLARYPYLVFYVERDDHIDIWRVLHTQRDIPAWMHDPANG